jgi:hypothetical protein
MAVSNNIGNGRARHSVRAVILILILKKPAKTDDEDEHEDEEEKSDPVFQTRS